MMNDRRARVRILMLIDKFDYHGSCVSGPFRSVSYLLSKLNRDKFDVVVVALRPAGRSAELLRRENVHVTYLGLSKYNPLSLPRLMKLIHDDGIDIVHLTGYGSTTFGRLAARLCGKSAIIHERWVDPHIGTFQVMLEKLLARYTTKAIANSEYSRRFLISQKGIPHERTVVIRNGVPLEHFAKNDRETGRLKRRDWGIPDNVIVVGIVGRLDEIKGHRYFLEAAALLVATRPKTVFVIVGDGELQHPLELLVRELGIEEYVLFVGHQQDMPAVLQSMDIFVIASLSETGPVTLLEAMAAGKAIVATDCGGPGEIIRDGVNGLLIPTKDPNAMAEKLAYLIDSPETRSTLGMNAQKDSVNYDIRITAQQIEAVFQEVAASQGKV
jgi:glycosyltransferase involved in cell wall biosynthesis